MSQLASRQLKWEAREANVRLHSVLLVKHHRDVLKCTSPVTEDLNMFFLCCFFSLKAAQCPMRVPSQGQLNKRSVVEIYQSKIINICPTAWEADGSCQEPFFCYLIPPIQQILHFSHSELSMISHASVSSHGDDSNSQ